MKRLHILVLTCVCLGIAAMLLFRVNTHAIAASASSCGSWTGVPGPTPDNNGSFSGVATIASNDIWAVGYSYLNNISQTLIEHWNGTAWSIVSSPNVPSQENALDAVTAVSTTDVWAVGTAYRNGGNGSTPLIEHWDGTAWSIIPGPNPRYFSGLSAVAAISANDIWAVGATGIRSNPYGGIEAFVEHWNGSRWSVVPSPTNRPEINLSSITAISTNDVWAVGTYYYDDHTTYSRTLVEHWDGSQWSIVHSPSPSPTKDLYYLNGVAAVSPNDIWAVGEYVNYSQGGRIFGLVEHWNGTTWNIVSSVQTHSPYVSLLAVGVVSATNIWAVGYSGNKSLTEHWDGTAWSIVPSPSPFHDPGSYSENEFNAVASVPGSNYVWAVAAADYITTTNSAAMLTAYYC